MTIFHLAPIDIRANDEQWSIERRDTAAGIDHRITERGLAALRMPR